MPRGRTRAGYASKRPAPELPDLGQAACASHPSPDLWHDEHRLAQAREVCGSCPVAAACLDYALDGGSSVRGIWAGTTEMQRIVLRRKRRKAA